MAGFVYPVDLSTQTSQAAIDLMYARANNSGNGYTKDDGCKKTSVDFTFNHELTKLVLNVKKDVSVTGDITAVSIKGMHVTADFDLTTGTLGVPTGNAVDIAPYTAVANSRYEAILLLATFTDAHTVVFTAGGEKYVWKMKSDAIVLICITHESENNATSASRIEIGADGNSMWEKGDRMGI